MALLVSHIVDWLPTLVVIHEVGHSPTKTGGQLFLGAGHHCDGGVLRCGIHGL